MYYNTNHLGSVIGLLDAQGKSLGQTSYGPYGEPEQTQGKSSDYRYAGMYYHASTGLYLTHYRFYDPQSGRWLNRDPIGEKGGVNLYNYAGSSAVNYKDSLGLYTGVDDAVFTLGGAVVGVLGQAAADLVNGQVSSATDYAGAAVGGAVGGEALLYLGPVASGALGGAASNLVKQGINMLDGKQCEFNSTSLLVDTAIGGALGLVPGDGIPGITSGRGSYNQIYKQMTTKLSNGSASSVSWPTAAKMAAGRAADTALLPGSAASGGAGGLAGDIPGYNQENQCRCSK